MRKTSQMGASKYEFAPERFELDIKMNQQRYEGKKKEIQNQVKKMLEGDPVRMDETISMYVEVLRDLKTTIRM